MLPSLLEMLKYIVVPPIIMPSEYLLVILAPQYDAFTQWFHVGNPVTTKRQMFSVYYSSCPIYI